MLEQGLGITTDGVTQGKMMSLWYDSDRILIEGVYCDEVTAYRARKRWMETLRSHFLLDDGLDFRLKVRRLRGQQYVRVQCSFLTACGRYAFWRLTHHQALEVQYLLESAHLPRQQGSLGISPFVEEEEFPCGVDSEEPRRELKKGAREKDAHGWQRVIRSIQKLADRLAGVTKGSDCTRDEGSN